MPSRSDEPPHPRRGRGRLGASRAFPSPATTIWLLCAAAAALAVGTLAVADGASGRDPTGTTTRTADATTAATTAGPAAWTRWETVFPPAASARSSACVKASRCPAPAAF